MRHVFILSREWAVIATKLSLLKDVRLYAVKCAAIAVLHLALTPYCHSCVAFSLDSHSSCIERIDIEMIRFSAGTLASTAQHF